MSQNIKYIDIHDLVLWTENPRDPIDTQSSDQDIADRAISSDGRSVWSLNKLFNTMGKRFDQSEIPTVAYIDGKPIVYDGNRRVLIGKIIHGCVKVEEKFINFPNFEFPQKVPCNVCDKQIALEHVDRKHADNGSWRPLERDIFKHYHMEEEKTPFLILEEATQLISNNPDMNQGFVKEEIFGNTDLHKLGFSTNNSSLKSKYQNDEDAEKVLREIVSLVQNKEITTRKNRGKITDLVPKDLLDKQGNDFKACFLFDNHKIRKTKITKAKTHELFGGRIKLKSGTVNNLYSDLLKLYKEKDKKGYSEDFPRIIRMGLRLLIETAAGEKDEKMDCYIRDRFEEAKQALSKDEKTTLHSQSVDSSQALTCQSVDSSQALTSSLNNGAHGYTSSNNLEQTIAMSLVIGKMLEMDHAQ